MAKRIESGLQTAKWLSAALCAAAVFGMAFVACEDALTKDDVNAAVAEELGRNNQQYVTTIEQVFKSGFEDAGYTVTGGLGGWGSNNALTVTSNGSVASFSFGSGSTLDSSLVVSDRTTYTYYPVQLKLASGTPSVYISGSTISYTLTGTTLNTARSATFNFQIINPENEGQRISGILTLTVTPTEAGILREVAQSFERSLLQTVSANSNATDVWMEKEINAWGQTDAKFTATIKKASSSSNITLPSYISNVTVSYSKSTGTTGGATNSITGDTGSSSCSLTFPSTLTAGSITVPFTLTGTVTGLVSGKTVKGNLVITTKE